MRRASCRILSILVAPVTALCLQCGAQALHHRPSAALQPDGAPPAPAQKTAQPAPQKVVLPKGASLQVEVTRQYSMKDGESIEGQLMHPIYAGGRLAVPDHTLLRGKVIALVPDGKTRWRARLRGDFTPFHIAKVQFDELMLPSGPMAISASAAADGAPLLHLTAVGASPKRSFIRAQWSQAKNQLHDRVVWFFAPGLGDRALQMLYHQLPYHPERIGAHTAWSFELTAPLSLPGLPTAAANSGTPAPAGKPEIWTVNASLMRELTSATARPGDSVKALVVEPVFGRDRQLVVPQGSVLIGHVTAARAARSFGRNGKLRFTFQQVRFPQGFGKPVEGSLAGASAQKTQDLQLDAEGTVTPRNRSSAVAPMLLTMLAGRALDQDGNFTTNSTVASNGFGLVGRIVGVAAGNRNLAAGIGFYAAGLSFYDNFLRTGRDVIFPKDTRIEIETIPLRAPLLKTEGQ